MGVVSSLDTAWASVFRRECGTVDVDSTRKAKVDDGHGGVVARHARCRRNRAATVCQRYGHVGTEVRSLQGDVDGALVRTTRGVDVSDSQSGRGRADGD